VSRILDWLRAHPDRTAFVTFDEGQERREDARDEFTQRLMQVDPRDPQGRKFWVTGYEKELERREVRLYSEFAEATGLPQTTPALEMVGSSVVGLPGMSWATATVDLSQLQARRQAIADAISGTQTALQRTLAGAQRRLLEMQLANYQAERDRLDVEIAAEKERIRKLGYNPSTGEAVSGPAIGAKLYEQLEERMGLPR
jgi:hypothetical protein